MTDRLGRVFPAAAADHAGPSQSRTGSSAVSSTPVSGLDGPETIPLRPLSFREQVDLPFAVIQADVRKLIVFVVAGLVLAADLVIAVTSVGSVLTDGSDSGTAWSAILSTAVTAWLLRLFLRGVTVPIGVARITGDSLTWRAALRRFGGKLGPLLLDRLQHTLTSVLVPAVWILVGLWQLGSVLDFPAIGAVCVILGIIVALIAAPLAGWLRARRMCAVPVLFAESASYGVSVGRAKILAAGAEWRLAGLWLSLRALLLLVSVPLLGLPLFVSDFSGTHRWAVIVLSTASVLLISAFAEVVDAAGSVVVYIDRRCRREAWDVRIPRAAHRDPETVR
ncbi:hypothetical protein [Nocardia macrotermitis]|uniref:Uncharacterized protein n=1 Tax=Nocardia macrotermitis TaxID=2585198 RepID=A0A7K0D9R9_9NOCA|nr:hypothetical protein [Nocardia macrotermitis]MQY22311.1 hypothetical protein [Nocardia macrotermitis]